MQKEAKTKQTKEKILSAATAEFGANGYAGGSLNNICNTGIAKGLLYHNFENKDALYLACVERCFHTLTEHLKSADIGTDLQRYTEVRLAFFREHEYESRLFFESLLQPPVQLKEEIAQAKAEFDSFNQSIYDNILATLELRPDVTKEDASRYFRLMQDMLNGYFSSPAASGMSLADTVTAHEKGVLTLLDLMLYGIAKRG